LIRKYNCAEKIVVFDDPQNAIDYFASLKEQFTEDMPFPELVLSDFNMPGMNGFEVIKRIRDLDLPREMFFCILSASIDRMDNAILEKNHVLKQLIKPLEKKEFADVLESIHAYEAVNA
jgi:CheY-like chemotaxis protein